MMKVLDVEEAARLIAEGIDVVDVREPWEYAEGHIAGARLVPLGSLRERPSEAGFGARALFVCAKGGRSLSAAELAHAAGVTESYSLAGGTEAWIAKGREVERGAAPSPAPAASSASPVAAEVDTAGLDEVIAKNVRELRAQRGFTLDVLAGASGVGRQTLGQIELGRTIPSVSTLWKIAKAFDVPFSTLIAEESRQETRVLRGESAKRLVSADGRFSSRALFPFEKKGNVEFYELWLAGHAREAAEAHAAGTRENLIVTAGRLVVEVAKERYELGKGDAIVFMADVPHAYVNPSGEECRMNLVMTYR